jgi:hypothetical protein
MDLPSSSNDILPFLNFPKCLGESHFLIFKTTNTSSKQEMGCSIQRIPKQQIANVKWLPLLAIPSRALPDHLLYKNLDMFLKDP